MAVRRERGHRLLLCIIAILVISIGTICYMGVRSATRKMAAITVEPIRLAEVRDGEYEGEFDGGLVKARVKVSVAGHRIVRLAILKHDNGRGKAAESIVNAVLKAQALDVDAVSGATHSSRVILKASEIALRKGLTE